MKTFFMSKRFPSRTSKETQLSLKKYEFILAPDYWLEKVIFHSAACNRNLKSESLFLLEKDLHEDKT